MMQRQGTAHIEPFDGSPEMLSIRESVEERTAAGHTRVIVTARVAAGPAWSTIIVFPPRAGRR